MAREIKFEASSELASLAPFYGGKGYETAGTPDRREDTAKPKAKRGDNVKPLPKRSQGGQVNG